jgi:hypothetical protein
VVKTWGWYATVVGVAVAVWRGRAWWKVRTNRRIKVDAVSEHWIAQQRGRTPVT